MRQFKTKAPGMSKNRSLRQMKKLHIGPFQEMGMDITIRYNEDVTTEQKDKFFDKFIEDCIEANNMLLGGSWYTSFVVLGKGSCDGSHMEILNAFLSNHMDIIKSVKIELVDSWYGPFRE